MVEAFSLNRQYDYIREDGLFRVTGQPAHEWDVYIIKELIDNALDADEAVWHRDITQTPALNITVEYIAVPPPQCQQLLVRVENRSRFPVQQIEAIFDTQRYTTRKAFFKGLTRGALGNALKTLLGIPYALHHRVADDWLPDLKPLSICCGTTEYQPRYHVDTAAKTIDFTCQTKPCTDIAGTRITVQLDYFDQDKPQRTLAELQHLAEHYALCNPHTAFSWQVELQGTRWEHTYPRNEKWQQKYRGHAPIHWYSLSAFIDLLGAFLDEQKGTISPERLCHVFTNSDMERHALLDAVIPIVGDDNVTLHDIKGPRAKDFYQALFRKSPIIPTKQLGAIGLEQLQTVLSIDVPLAGPIEYLCEYGPDQNLPFVLEAAVAPLSEGKRQLWTAINFTPTYNDPFLSRWLELPQRPDEPVLGLRGLLDAYALGEETPVLIWLHLICPTIEYTDFGKTEVDHLPFKKTLSKLLDTLLTRWRQSQDEEALRLEQTIFQALNLLLPTFPEGERMLPEQLVAKVREHLRQNPALTNWLGQPENTARLLSYIENYRSLHETMNHFVATQAITMLSVPLHPDHYFSIPIEHLSQDLLEQHAVNKLLYVQPSTLETVVFDNHWLCRMDMALLHAPAERDALLYCINQCSVPILVLHEADDAGHALVEQMRAWLVAEQLDPRRIVDLQPANTPEAELIHPLQMLPSQIEQLLCARLRALSIPVKFTPTHLRQDIRTRFDTLLREYMMERLEEQFDLMQLIVLLGQYNVDTQTFRQAHLDELIQYRLAHTERTASYNNVAEHALEEFFQHFLEEQHTEVRQRIQQWLQQKDGKST